MKANELRLGNYVECSGVVHKLTEITVRECRFNDDCGEALNKVKPISLTKEYLIKSGFEYDEVYKDYQKGNVVLRPDLKASNFYVLWLNVGIRNIRYVHQLQNLYYALMEEELVFE